MTAMRKKILTVIMSFVALFAMTAGISLSVQVAKADAAIVFAPGAYIRIDTEHDEATSTTGIKFKATVDSSLYTADEVGMIIIPSTILSKFDAQKDKEGGITDLFTFCSTKYGKDKADISKSISAEKLSANSGEMVGAIVNIKDANYKNEYTAIAYSLVGSAYTYYRSNLDKTIVEMANAAFGENQELEEEDKYSDLQLSKLTGIIKKSIQLDLGGSGISKDLAIGKTIDLGKAFTDEAIIDDVTWSVKSGSDKVAIGGDNVQAVASGKAVLTVSAYNGDLTFDVEINAAAGESAEDVCDFVVEVPTGRDIKILQITDTQFVNYDKTSHGAATIDNLYDVYTEANFGINCLNYIQAAFDRVSPDLIIMTGDNVFGRFDPDGTAFTALVTYLDSLNVPWAAVYGNHDNESEMGALWQNEQLSNSVNGMFLRGVTDGNGNYTLGLKQGGEIKRVFCMMDTNTCSGAYQPAANHVTTTTGFTDAQVQWFKRTLGALQTAAGETVPVSMAYHVPNYAYQQAKDQYSSAEADIDTYYYTLGLDFAANSGDFGSYNNVSNNELGTFDNNNGSAKTYGGETLVTIYKAKGVDSVFCGHEHQVSTSIEYDDIRWTFGLKTGIYDIPEKDNLGGTAITIDKTSGDISVNHVYYSTAYQTYKDAIRNGDYVGTTFEGLTVRNKDNDTIGIENTQKGTVTKEVVGGYAAYKLSADRQCKFPLNSDLLASGESVTFSYYVPSTNKGFYGANWRSFGIFRGASNNAYYFLQAGEGHNYATDYTYFDDFDTWYTATVSLRINGEKIPEFSWLVAKNGGEVYIKDITVNTIRTSGNIAPTAKTDGIVSSYRTDNRNNVFNYSDGYLYFWTHINQINHMVFDSDYIKDMYSSGLTHITMTFHMTMTVDTWSSVYFGYLDDSNKFTALGDAIAIRKANDAENPVTATFDLWSYLYNKIDFDSGYRFVLGNLAAGSNDPIKMSISHLEFGQPTTTGNIATANTKTNGIVSPVKTNGNNNVFNYGDYLYFQAGSWSWNIMRFDDDYIKQMYATGLTKITMTYYMYAQQNRQPYEGYLAFGKVLDRANESDVVKEDMTLIGDEVSVSLDYTSSNQNTVEFTLTKEIYESIDFSTHSFALGRLFGYGDSTNDKVILLITSLEFSRP